MKSSQIYIVSEKLSIENIFPVKKFLFTHFAQKNSITTFFFAEKKNEKESCKFLKFFSK